MKAIILGAGEVGYHLAQRLSQEGVEVVIVDNDPARIRLVETMDVHGLVGEGASPRLLKEAGIEDAELLIAVTTNDEVNMVACLIASIQSKVGTKIARIRNLEYLEVPEMLDQQHLGVDLHINPELEAAESIARILEVPAAHQVIEFAEGRVKLVGLHIVRESPITGVELQYQPVLQPTRGILIAAIQRGGDLLIPHGYDKIECGDLVWFVCMSGEVNNALQAFGVTAHSAKKVVIYGGSKVGYFLARKIEGEVSSLKLVEPAPERCEQLSQELDRTLILNGEATDQRLLEEEDMGDMDVLVAVTDDDEDNVLAALLAKRIGVPRVVTLIKKASYFPVLQTIGVDNVVSTRIAAVNKILQFIRKGAVLSATALGETDAEAIEFRALATSDVVGKTLAELKFPKDSIVGAVLRGDDVLIPGGATEILEDDRVIMLARKSSLARLERLFSVKLEYF